MKRVLPLVVVPMLLLAGCSGTAGTSSSGGRIAVVASTDVWGDIVEQVGGDRVSVTSIIDDPNQDPHEYQADARDQLAVSRARLVVVNGGGYDDFLSQLLKNAPSSTRTLDAADDSGLDLTPESGEFNEHIWYDFGAVSKVAGAVATELGRLDPAHASEFTKRLGSFRSALTALEQEEADIRTTAKGKGVAITEPVPLYMTAAAGLVNRTPAAFSEAVEAGDDVAPAVLKQELELFTGHEVAVLAYNDQTVDATTIRVLDAAKAAGIPVVGVRETLPAGEGYLAWMRSDLAALKRAVA